MIRFQCSCGKRLKVEDGFAGHLVECTACGKRRRAPAASAGPGPSEALQAMSRQFQRPQIPVAEVVEEPATEAEDPLAALARAANGNGGAKVKKPPSRPAVASRLAGPPAKLPGKKPSATEEILGRKRPAAAHNNQKTMIIVGGVTGLIVLVALIVLVVSALDSPPPPAEQPKAVQATPPPKWRPSSPGELFPNVAPEPALGGSPSTPEKPEK